MRIRYLKLRSWLLAALAGVMGISFSNCEKYGCPEADYHVKGTVTNEKGQPIAGIAVGYSQDTTGPDGRYAVDFNDAAPGEPLSIKFKDIDGSENGSYSDTVVVVPTENVQLANAPGSHSEWYEGEATITRNVILKEKINK